MKALLMCGVLSLIGLFACVEPPDPAPAAETATELSTQDGELSTQDGELSTQDGELSTQDGELADEAPALSGGGTCCIVYDCPTNGFSTIGCKSGSSGPGRAFARCMQHCGGVACEAADFYCE
jgi:hypothetical protein